MLTQVSQLTDQLVKASAQNLFFLLLEPILNVLVQPKSAQFCCFLEGTKTWK
jgi:hypothetical protein